MRQLRPCIFPLNLSTSGKQGGRGLRGVSGESESFYTMSIEYHFANIYTTVIIVVYECVRYMPRVHVFLLAAK